MAFGLITQKLQLAAEPSSAVGCPQVEDSVAAFEKRRAVGAGEAAGLDFALDLCCFEHSAVVLSFAIDSSFLDQRLI